MDILNRTVHSESRNIRLLKNKIQDMEKSWPNFHQKLRNYLSEGIFVDKEAKVAVKIQHVAKNEA